MVEGLVEGLRERFPRAAVTEAEGFTVIEIPSAELLECAGYLRSEGFNLLRDITSVDNPDEVPRFEVIYHIEAVPGGRSVRVRTRTDDGESVPSVTSVWPGANMPEREVYDLMGIVFEGHPDPRRILLSDDWEGHPLRKDYPTEGYAMWDWEAHR